MYSKKVKMSETSNVKKKKFIDTRAYEISNEVLNASTHGIGFIAAIIGMVFLILKAKANQNTMELVSYIIYGTSMCIMFLVSCLYHSLKNTKASKVFNILDHNGIFLLIAGSYTPYCFVTIRGWVGWTVFAIEWTLAILGIIGKASGAKWLEKISTAIYIGMGWIALLALKPLYDGMGWPGLMWLIIGGVFYTVGVIFYAIGKKNGFPYAHVVWHIFVFFGCAGIFISIYKFV